MPRKAPQQGCRAVFANGAVLVALVVALLAGATSAPAAHSAACHLKWRLAPSPKLSAATLADVDALGRTDVWAAGQGTDLSSDQPIVVEHWDGRRWHVRHLAYRGHVQGLSAKSRRDIWVVANTQLEKPLILHYDGRSWTPTPGLIAPSERGYLWDVVGLSRNDAWAVGSVSADTNSNVGLIFHWNGSHWKRLDSPPGVTALYGLAPSSSHVLLAVGETAGAKVVMRWDGTSWHVFKTALRYIDVLGVRARSPNDLWAVGATVTNGGLHTGAFVAHWNGHTFRLVRRVRDVVLADVAASGRHVWAVGGEIDHWDGQRWRRVSTNPNVRLSGADALSPRDVWAVGDAYSGGAAIYRAAIYHYACR